MANRITIINTSLIFVMIASLTGAGYSAYQYQNIYNIQLVNH